VKVSPGEAETDIRVTPASGVRGKKYDLTLTARDADCKMPDLDAASASDKTKSKWRVQELNGPKVHPAAPSGFGKCFLIVPVTIDEDASIGPVFLPVVADGKTYLAKFEVMAVAPGPVPPGLSPPYQVDVMWGVLPRRITRDNFGHFISDKYYAIEVIIGNDSGYPLQIAGAGFCLNQECPDDGGLPNKVSIAPTSSYRVTRGTLRKGQETGQRAVILHIIQALGPLATGFVAFFHNTNHKANYSSAVDIFSNPFEKGFELMWPDTTIQELLRLDDQMLRDGLVIPNNTQVRTLVFFPKENLARYLPKQPGVKSAPKTTKLSPDAACSSLADHTLQFYRSTPGKCASGANLDDVMHALGRLVLVGETIQYLNRVRVESNPPGPVNPPPSGLKINYTDPKPTDADVKTDSVSKKVSITGLHLKDASLYMPEGQDALLVKDQTVVNEGELDATIQVTKGTKPRTYTIIVRNSGGADTVNFEVVPADAGSPPDKAATPNPKAPNPPTDNRPQ